MICSARTDAIGVRTRRSERGSAALLVAVLVVATALGAAVLAQLGDAAVRRARVEAHADAAALAAATEGGAAASAVLVRSGAQLVDTTAHPGGEWTVVIELDGLQAKATAALEGARFEHDR